MEAFLFLGLIKRERHNVPVKKPAKQKKCSTEAKS